MVVDGLHEEQKQAFDIALRHLINQDFYSKYMILNGAGGSGKSYVINTMTSMLDKDALNPKGTVLAFTGRACTQLNKDGINARTCHSLLFEPIVDADGNLIKFEKRPTKDILDNAGSFLIVDEASMIPKDIFEALDGLGLPILFVGDNSQLPPVDRTNPDFSVMESLDCPVLTLVENHRQTKDSGIERLCSHLREEDSIKKIRAPDLRYIPKSKITKEFFENNEFDVVACGTNKMRKKVNALIRAAKGFDPSVLPQEGEQVVCTKNTMIAEKRISNGEIFVVDGAIYGDSISKYFMKSVDTGEVHIVNVLNTCWEDEYSSRTASDGRPLGSFAYGYCLSVHKCQGSTIENVLFIDENVRFFLNQQRFRYTAVSRASKKLTIAI